MALSAVNRRRAVIGAALAAVALSVLGGLATEIGPWYYALKKPSWQPPDWLFGPVWTTIYALAAISGVKAAMAAPDRGARLGIAWAFAINGVFNVLWSLLFFRMHRPDWALVELAFLWASIVALMIVTGRHRALSAWLLLPYLLWVSFAGFLNYTIVQLNGPFGRAAGG